MWYCAISRRARSDEVLAESLYAKARTALERATGQTLAVPNIEFDEAYRREPTRLPSPAPVK